VRSYENEPFVIGRPVEAVMVPSGTAITLQPGVAGYITQALGGSFTLYVEGNLYRLSGEQADAIGKEAVKAPELPPNATEDDVRELAWQQMRSCYDPEIPVNIVDLGLVYECTVNANEDGTRSVKVDMTLTAPGCGMGEVLVADVREKIEAIPTVSKADVSLVFDPPWSQSMMSDAAKLQTGMMW
jgi:probable FeS assembly SUF system protein SufT